MPTISHPTSAGVPFWKRFYRAIAAYEDAMDFDPTERAVAALQKRTAVLEERSGQACGHLSRRFTLIEKTAPRGRNASAHVIYLENTDGNP